MFFKTTCIKNSSLIGDSLADVVFQPYSQASDDVLRLVGCSCYPSADGPYWFVGDDDVFPGVEVIGANSIGN